MAEGKLRKSQDKVLTGVLGGVAEHFDADPTLVRVLYVLIALVTAVVPAIIVYLVMALVMPE